MRRRPQQTETQPKTAPDDITARLIEEARDVGGRIGDLIMSGERMLATTVALIALAGSVALGNNRGYLLMAVPFAMSVVICFMLYLNNGAMTQAGYKRAIEEAIAARLGAPVIQWESVSQSISYNKVPVVVLGVLTLLAYSGASTVAVLQAWAARRPGRWGYPDWTLYFSATVASIAIGLAAIIICYKAQGRGRWRAYDKTRQRLQSIVDENALA